MADKKTVVRKGELSLLRRFMKKLDPGSAVREGELSAPDRATLRRLMKKLDPGSVVRAGE